MTPHELKKSGRLDILVAIPALGSGGAERTVAAITSAWVSEGRAVGVVTASSPQADFYALDPAVERHALNRPPAVRASDQVRATVALTKHLYATVRARRPRILLSFLPAIRLPAFTAATLGRVPLVVCERNNPMLRHQSRRRRLIGWVVEHRAAANVVQSQALRDRAVERGVRRVWAIPNFLTPDVLAQIDAETERADRSDDHRLVAMGRLVDQKGFDVLVRAFALTSAAHPSWRLDIYGEGPGRPRLEQLARDEGIASRVSFPGITARPGAVLAAADAFVLSSRFEGYPNVLLEAMAAGAPVVSTACDFGPSEIIRDHVDGILVRPDDVHDLARGLSTVLGDAPLRKQLGAAAVDVRRRLSLDTVMAQWNEVVDQVIAT